MRKRPFQTDKEFIFINNALGEKLETETVREDLHRYVRRAKWPVFQETVSPSVASSSNLLKPLSIPMKEFEWDSIERHIKALGVRKAEWIRYAIFKLMEEEQLFFLRSKDKND